MKTTLRTNGRWIYAVFAAMVVLFLFDVIFFGRVLLLRDTFADFIPKLQVARRALQDFSIPFWNPQTGSGHPYLADPYTGAAYPLNAIFFIFPPSFAHKMTLVVHLSLAGWGMLALSRLWGFGAMASLVAALGFVFSTYVVAVAEFFNILFPLCWGPPILFLGCLIYQRVRTDASETSLFRLALRNWGVIVVLALSFACAYLAGNPQYLVFAIGLVTAYHVARLIFDRDWRAAAISFGAFLGAGGLAVLLSMPQILLFLELLGESLRSEGIDPELAKASVAPGHFLSAVFPFLFGKASWPVNYWADSVFEFWLGAFYVGLLPLVAALLPLRSFLPGERNSEADRQTRFFCFFFAAMIVIGVVLASGRFLPVYQFLVDYAPGFDKVRWPSRFMLVWVYFVPLAAALGLHLLLESKTSAGGVPRWFKAVVLGAGGVAGLFWVGLLAGGDLAGQFSLCAGRSFGSGLFEEPMPVEPTPERLALFREDLLSAALFMTLTAGALAFLVWSRPGRASRWSQFLVVAVTFLNVMVVGRRVHHTSDVDVYAYQSPAWQTVDEMASKEGIDHWRLYSQFGINQWNLYGIEDPEIWKLAKDVSVGETWLQSTHDRAWRSSLALERYYDLFHLIGRLETEEASLKLISLLNVRFIIYGRDWPTLVAGAPGSKPGIVPWPSGLPRAFLTTAWQLPDGFDDGVDRLTAPEFDLRRQILLEPAEDGSLPDNFMSSKPGGEVRGRVTKLEYDWNRAELTVESEEPCLLVLLDSWFPGWKVRVNGEAAPIYRANLLYRAVDIPAGSSRVVFDYRPVRFKIGLIGFALAVAVMGTGFFLRRKLTPRRVPPQEPALEPADDSARSDGSADSSSSTTR